MRRLVPLALVTSALVAACDASLLRLLPAGIGGPSATPDPSECTVVREVPAPIFHVAVTSPASAGATVSLEPWVFLEAPIQKHDRILPGTFRATVDEQAREIVVSGMVEATRPNPVANCGFPAIYTFPKAATLSLPVVLTAPGAYTVRIASASFTTRRPEAIQHPDQPPKVYPPVAATGSLVID